MKVDKELALQTTSMNAARRMRPLTQQRSLFIRVFLDRLIENPGEYQGERRNLWRGKLLEDLNSEPYSKKAGNSHIRAAELERWLTRPALVTVSYFMVFFEIAILQKI